MNYSFEKLKDKSSKILTKSSTAITNLINQIDDNLLNVIDILDKCHGHVIVAGVGTSCAVARRFAHLLSCCNTPSFGIGPVDSLHGGAGTITSNDVLFIISKGGLSTEIYQLAKVAHSEKAKVIVQTSNIESPICDFANSIIPVVYEENIDAYELVATGSSLINCAIGSVICEVLIELKGFSLKKLNEIHKGGAVSQKLSDQF